MIDNERMINKERLASTFCRLVEIDSISREEKQISESIQKIFSGLGAELSIDGAGEKINSNTGNLVAKFKGNVDVPPMVLSGHMDTVEPGKGVIPVFKDGVFSSKGETILGADDKSAIAIIIELMHVLKENNLKYGPIEVVLTVCEEIGLQGAKHFDFSLIDSTFGYILDSTDADGIVTRAPYANRFEIKVFGKAAHAGAEPEKGISAVKLASQAIASLNLGRLDHETTCNIGKVNAGVATNIVPELAVIDGEARSHSKEKLDNVMDEVLSAFEKAVSDYKKNKSDSDLPRIEVIVQNDFPGTHIPDSHQVVQLAKKAAKNIDMSMESKTIGGGADANIFFEKGIITGVLGTGMKDVHTIHEFIALNDMARTTELLLEIIRIHSETVK